MGTMFCLDSRKFFISSLNLSRMARDGGTLVWLVLVCRPVTSVSLSFLIFSFLSDLRKEKMRALCVILTCLTCYRTSAAGCPS